MYQMYGGNYGVIANGQNYTFEFWQQATTMHLQDPQ